MSKDNFNEDELKRYEEENEGIKETNDETLFNIKAGEMLPPDIDALGDVSKKTRVEKIQEEVEKKWTIKLLRGKYNEYIVDVFFIEFNSKFGATLRCLYSDMYDPKKEKGIIRDLMNIGLMKYDDYTLFKEYITHLIDLEKYESVENLDETITSDSDKDEAEKYYNMVVEHIRENLSLFPSSNEGLKDGDSKGKYIDKVSHGAKIDDEAGNKKYGADAYAFVSEPLRDLLSITNTKKYGAVLDKLIEIGVLYRSIDGRKDPKVKLAKDVEQRAYVFYINPSLIKAGGGDNDNK